MYTKHKDIRDSYLKLVKALKRGCSDVTIKDGYYIYADICNNGDINCAVVRERDDYVYENLSNWLESKLLKDRNVKKLIKLKKDSI